MSNPKSRIQNPKSTDEVALYDYALPDELIARHPAAKRDEARLMVVDRAAASISHAQIRDLPRLLRTGDCLVLNDTKVLSARLQGSRVSTGGKWEGLFLSGTDAPGQWRLMGQTRGRLQSGEQIAVRSFRPEIATELRLTLLERDEEGIWTVHPDDPRPAPEILDDYGAMPLPPYIGREQPEAEDRERYQTVYARALGSVAAPTAGLHFTPELLSACEAAGIGRATVTLHVGIGTFRPIAVERLSEHRMHAEWCTVSPSAVSTLAATRCAGGRIVAVGTTSVRTLESATIDGMLHPWTGPTSLFIRPPYRLQSVDALLTNFHLPRSSLLVLVSAFAGRELILRAYADAISQRYRFFSYGDAMLIV